MFQRQELFEKAEESNVPIKIVQFNEKLILNMREMILLDNVDELGNYCIKYNPKTGVSYQLNQTRTLILDSIR
jgi:hypothetical protein